MYWLWVAATLRMLLRKKGPVIRLWLLTSGLALSGGQRPQATIVGFKAGGFGRTFV